MNVRYRVTLEAEERDALEAMVRGGKCSARRLKRAQILLAADRGSTDEVIATNVVVGTSTVFRTKRRFVDEGFEAALNEQPRPGASRKLDTKDEALLIAIACSDPPSGRARWTLSLLADEMVRLTQHESVSAETVRRRLAENELKPWLKKMWCIPKVDHEFVARMENVLELYAERADPKRPVVCFDETPRQLIGESRVPVARNGTANVFMMIDAHRPWRCAKVTDQRTALDFAECMRDLVDTHYPKAERIRVVLDNLSTHAAGSLYVAFEPAEARRILRKVEFHYTPTHASWLNMVEIEIGVMVSQCLDRRIATKEILIAEVRAWERARNRDGARIKWMFTVERAREKLGRSYPVVLNRPARKAA
jgi:transposase